MKRAIFPGTFDPFTIGHLYILEKSIKIFDEVIIAIGKNHDKKTMFTVDKRKEFIELATSKYQNIKVMIYDGLTVDFCEKTNSNFIVRGIRNVGDFESNVT